MTKLDRFLISESVSDSIPYAHVTVLDRLWSDHNPVIFHVSKVDYGPIPFKNFHSWLHRNDLDEVIKSGYSNALDSSFHSKLKSLKASEENKVTRVNLLHEYNELEKFSEMDVLQKSHVKWDAKGDVNTKFFHGLLKQKRRHQSIQGITIDGTWITDPHQVKSAFLNFFKVKFQETEAPIYFNRLVGASILNDSDRAILEFHVLMDEIKTVVWDCGSNKALGPDGFLFFFIKNYWDLLKDDSYSFVDNFLTSGIMPPGLNSPFITLVPKISNPINIKDFWPISLIGFSIKCGLRQGEPLSPFLFIIVMEGLHIAINEAVQTNLIRGAFVGAAEFNVSHLFFADDVVIVTE
ncbi:hypothetical protein Tco_0815521 [Tanacetum coccineum]